MDFKFLFLTVLASRSVAWDVRKRAAGEAHVNTCSWAPDVWRYGQRVPPLYSPMLLNHTCAEMVMHLFEMFCNDRKRNGFQAGQKVGVTFLLSRPVIYEWGLWHRRWLWWWMERWDDLRALTFSRGNLPEWKVTCRRLFSNQCEKKRLARFAELFQTLKLALCAMWRRVLPSLVWRHIISFYHHSSEMTE